MASSLFDDQLTTNIGNLNAHRQPSAHLPSSLSSRPLQAILKAFPHHHRPQ